MNSTITLRHISPKIRTAVLTAIIVSFPNLVCLPYEWTCLCGTECRIIIAAYFIFRFLMFATTACAQAVCCKKLSTSSLSRIVAVSSGISAMAYLLTLPVSAAIAEYIPTDARGSILVFQFMVIAGISSAMAYINSYKTAIDDTQSESKEDIPHKMSHLLIGSGDKILPIDTDKIAFIYASNKKASVTTLDGYVYQYSQSLEQTMSALKEENFFRVNKQYIISKKAVTEIVVWFDNRLLIKLSGPEPPEPVYVSKNKASLFKKWMAR